MAPLEIEIVEAIAAEKGTDPADLDEPLYNYVDLDAVRTLRAHETGSWTLTFEIPGHTVTVTSDADVSVDPRRSPDDPGAVGSEVDLGDENEA